MSKKFNVGDKVKCISEPCYSFGYQNVGVIVTVSNITGEGKITEIEEWKHHGWCYENEWFELLSNKNNIMANLKEKFVGIFISEPNKTFRKVGITNGDNMLTSEGQEVFISWLLQKHGDEFKTEVADKMVEETK